MRLILTLTFIATIGLTAFSQDLPKSELGNQKAFQTYSYAYISVEGKTFSKKLKVEVDFGDAPEQIKAAKEYSDTLTNKKSYAAILNYMAERQFELAGSRENSFTFQGTGGSTGVVFIMRRRNN